MRRRRLVGAGLASALVLFVAVGSWWGAARIEGDLTGRSQAVLDVSGIPGVVVEYSGRDATLRGSVPDAAAEAEAVAAVAAVSGTRSVTSLVEVGLEPAPGAAGDGGSAGGDSTTDPGEPGAAQGAEPSPDPTPETSPDPEPEESPEPALEVVVRFDVASAELSAEARATLDDAVGRIADDLADDPEARLLVEGHTDDVGSDDLNERLSRERAEAVASYLVAAGVDPDRLDVRSYADTRPLGPNDTDEGRAANRRTELRTIEEST